MTPVLKIMTGRGAATVLFVAALAATTAQAQRSGRSGSTPPQTRETVFMNELEREMNQRTMEDHLNRPVPRREPKLSFAQISEDFMRIQVINNELVLAARQKADLDLKFVAKSTAEIRKLAERLKENLVLPEPEADAKRATPAGAAEAEELKPALKALGELIAGFAHNPVFKEPKVVDAQMSAKARGDLEEIIELSGQLRKTAEKISKTAQKSP